MALQEKTAAWGGHKRTFLFLVGAFFVFMEAGRYAGRKELISGQLTAQLVPDALVANLPLQLRPDSSHLHAHSTEHPIAALMAAAEDRHRARLARQSRTLADAVAVEVAPLAEQVILAVLPLFEQPEPQPP